MKVAIPQLFPNSRQEPFDLTSSETKSYNCIAWAYEDNTRWYWPDPSTIYFWPPGVPREETLAAFIILFESIGYTQCENGDLEDGYLKVAVYTNNLGIPTHAARQLSNGLWTSKLGDKIDVSHTLLSMEGGVYGNVVAFLRRSTV